MKIQVTVNGVAHESDVEPRTLLVHYVREVLGLTGTNIGCDTSSCGACTVHVNGESVKSCTMLAMQADGANVTTIEGLADGDKLHPMQAAFREHHGLQASAPMLTPSTASPAGPTRRLPRNMCASVAANPILATLPVKR